MPTPDPTPILTPERIAEICKQVASMRRNFEHECFIFGSDEFDAVEAFDALLASHAALERRLAEAERSLSMPCECCNRLEDEEERSHQLSRCIEKVANRLRIDRNDTAVDEALSEHTEDDEEAWGIDAMHRLIVERIDKIESALAEAERERDRLIPSIGPRQQFDDQPMRSHEFETMRKESESMPAAAREAIARLMEHVGWQEEQWSLLLCRVCNLSKVYAYADIESVVEDAIQRWIDTNPDNDEKMQERIDALEFALAASVPVAVAMDAICYGLDVGFRVGRNPEKIMGEEIPFAERSFPSAATAILQRARNEQHALVRALAEHDEARRKVGDDAAH